MLISWKKIDRDQRSDKVSSYSSQLTGVEIEIIKIGGKPLPQRDFRLFSFL